MLIVQYKIFYSVEEKLTFIAYFSRFHSLKLYGCKKYAKIASRLTLVLWLILFYDAYVFRIYEKTVLYNFGDVNIFFAIWLLTRNSRVET